MNTNTLHQSRFKRSTFAGVAAVFATLTLSFSSVTRADNGTPAQTITAPSATTTTTTTTTTATATATAGVGVGAAGTAGTGAPDASTGAGAPQAATKTPEANKRVCVNAEIDGVRALSYDCLSQQLAPTPTIAEPGSPANPAEALATASSNRSGTFNESAEHNRFGSNWGKSVTPQRPPPIVAVPVR